MKCVGGWCVWGGGGGWGGRVPLLLGAHRLCSPMHRDQRRENIDFFDLSSHNNHSTA